MPTAIIDGGGFGADVGRVFQLVVAGITVNINNVIIQNGDAATELSGGGIFSGSLLTPPAHGRAIVDLGEFATYTPNVGWFGPDTFVIKVQDNGILPLSGTVTVIVKKKGVSP